MNKARYFPKKASININLWDMRYDVVRIIINSGLRQTKHLKENTRQHKYLISMTDKWKLTWWLVGVDDENYCG